ncbi:MAG: lytic murein transglycosylase B [Rubrivivax sp.]
MKIMLAGSSGALKRRRRQRLTVRSLPLLLCVATGLIGTSVEAASGKPRSTAAATVARSSPAAAAQPSAGLSYQNRSDVVAFAADVAARTSLPLEWLTLELSKARRNEAVRRLIAPPPAGTAKNWAAYRARFVEPQRIAAGLAFWRANESWLALAEQRHGVPAEIVVGIVGVETYYGRITGNFRVLDALATLAFDYPVERSTARKDRSDFFRSELEAFFVMCAREGLDPQSVQGSYAGAMGLPQFMPSSINNHAVDFDGDGHIDLQRSTADVIGSVAHYLAQYGWQRGVPTHFAVAAPVDSSDRAALLGPDILPSFSGAQFGSRGAVLAVEGQRFDSLLALVELQNGDLAPSFVAGTGNFYAVTRYNRSSYYALAVIELGQAVARARAGAQAAASGAAAASAAPATR